MDAYSFDLIVYWLGLGIFKLILVTSDFIHCFQMAMLNSGTCQMVEM